MDTSVATATDISSINTTLATKLTSTDIAGKLDSSSVGDKSLDGNFATLKVMDTSVATATDISSINTTLSIQTQQLRV
jgi:hypothetical protein